MVSETNSQIFTNIPLRNLEVLFKRWVNEVIKDVTPSTTTTPAEPEEKFSRTQLANYLQCTLPTIDRYRANGVFPVYQTGRTIYFKKSEVDRALLVGNKKGAKK